MKKKHLLLFLIIIITSACKNSFDKLATYDYPLPPKSTPINDTLFGNLIKDSFRNIEQTNDSIVTNWYKTQTLYTNSYLDRITGRDTLITTLHDISNRKSHNVKRVSRRENSQSFFLKKRKSENHYSLYYKQNNTISPELLYDPANYKPNTGNDYVINYIMPSWNGQYVAVSLTYAGRQLSDIIIIESKTKQVLPQVLKNAWPTNFLGINWLPDNSGFTYLYFPNTDISDPKFRRNSQSVMYKLGDDANTLTYIFGNKTHPQLILDEKLFPATKIKSSKDKYIVGYLAEVDNYWNAYYLSIDNLRKGKLDWKPFYKKSDKIMQSKGYFTDSSFVFLSAKEAENKKIMEVKTKDFNFANAKTIVPENDAEVIDDVEVTKQGVFYSTLKYGVEANLYTYKNGKIELLEIPKAAGKISIYSTSPQSDELWISLKGWSSPNLRYRYKSKDKTFTEDSLYPKIVYPGYENITVEEVLVTSHDGAEVPLSIIYDKSLKKDGNNPVFIYGYGAYGDIESPYFSTIMLNFVKEGGIFCTAHVRGGGEKGETWHKDGMKAKKYNTWKDLIACTEYLIDKKYTSAKHTAIYGGSAGGIMVGRAMTERPDLFQVAIIQSGYLNPFRAEQVGSAGTSTSEFGSIADEKECKDLIKLDPYLNIKKGEKYPATYLTVGMNDAIVMPWMTGKFAARLQQATSTEECPIFMQADFESGHEGSSDVMKIYKEWADIFSFVLWQTGHPSYQLKD